MEAGLDRERGRALVVWAVHLLPAQKDIVFVRIADIGRNTSPENHVIVKSAQNVALK